MRISSSSLLLRRHGAARSDSTTPVLIQDEANNASLSYHDAYSVSDRHRQWIERQVSRIVCRYLQNYSEWKNVEEKTRMEVNVVIAYLSHNSTDALLSLMGCMDIPNRKNMKIGNILPFFERGNTVRIRLIPALLNVRWTSSEIASALRVGSLEGGEEGGGDVGGGEVANQTHVTVILYGVGCEDAAQEAVKIISSDQAQLQRGHVLSRALPMPQFSLTDDIDDGDIDDDDDNVVRMDRIQVAAAVDSNNSDRIDRLFNNSSAFSKKHLINVDGTTTDSSPICSSLGTFDIFKTWHHDDAIILFTSGTSSSNGPKGVRLSHVSLFVQSMTKLIHPCCYTHQTKMLATTVPIFHVGGLSSVLAVIMAGGTLIFPRETKKGRHVGCGNSFAFRPDVILRSLSATKEKGANTLVVVPAMIHSLLRQVDEWEEFCTQQELTTASISSYPRVQLILVGGQSLTFTQYERAQQIFPNSKFVQTFACTEAGSSITFAELPFCYETNDDKWSKLEIMDRHDDDHGGRKRNVQTSKGGKCVGVPPPHVELEIFQQGVETAATTTLSSSSSPSSLSSGIPCQPYEVGLIGTRGPHVMNGYWTRGQPSKCYGNSSVITCDGWLITNDLGYLDHLGRLYFCGRTADVIRTGGESVLATEVEDVLRRHPNVDECAAFGLNDDKWGEIVCAAIVLRRRQGEGLVRWEFRGDDDGAFDIGRGKRTVAEDTPTSRRMIEEEIRQHCLNHHLANYKRPKRVFLLNALPRNSSGKVIKFKLVEMFNGQGDRTVLRSML